MTQTTRTQINGHFVNTCDNDDLRFIALYLKITPKQYSTYSSAGRAKLLSYVGTKLGNFLAGLGVEYLELDGLPSDAKPKQEAPKANPFTKPNAGAKPKGAPRAKTTLTGAYTLVKKGLKATATDPKWEIWTHIYECTTFEDVFAKAPAKVVKTGGKTFASPTTELGWALKQGWIVPATA
jgi:hypothetical protein